MANLLVDQNGIRVIDFDDCGYGWFMYDFAATISFVEDDPRILEFKSAWLEGYLTQRRLSAEDIQEIDTFVMLRRMALLAWIGSHMEAEPDIAPDFAQIPKNWESMVARRRCSLTGLIFSSQLVNYCFCLPENKLVSQKIPFNVLRNAENLSLLERKHTNLEQRLETFAKNWRRQRSTLH